MREQRVGMDNKLGASNKSRHSIWTWSTILLAVIVAGIIVAYLLGFIKVQRSNNEAVVTCGTSTVTAYNDLMEYKVRNDSVVPYTDKEGIKKLASDIKKREGYATDPTCQTMLFWAAFLDNNYAEAKKAHEAVASLHGQRKFADSNIHSNAPLFTYESTLYSIDPSNKPTEAGIGQ